MHPCIFIFIILGLSHLNLLDFMHRVSRPVLVQNKGRLDVSVVLLGLLNGKHVLLRVDQMRQRLVVHFVLVKRLVYRLRDVLVLRIQCCF